MYHLNMYLIELSFFRNILLYTCSCSSETTEGLSVYDDSLERVFFSLYFYCPVTYESWRRAKMSSHVCILPSQSSRPEITIFFGDLKRTKEVILAFFWNTTRLVLRVDVYSRVPKHSRYCFLPGTTFSIYVLKYCYCWRLEWGISNCEFQLDIELKYYCSRIEVDSKQMLT